MNPLYIFLALYFEDSDTKLILDRKSKQTNTKAMIVECIYEEDNTLNINAIGFSDLLCYFELFKTDSLMKVETEFHHKNAKNRR